MYCVCDSYLRDLNYSKLPEEAEKYLEAAGRESDSRHQAYAWFYKGSADMFSKNKHDASESFMNSLEAADLAGCDTASVLALNGLGIYQGFMKGNYPLSQGYFMQALKRADDKLAHIRSSIYCNIAELASLQKDTAGMSYAMLGYETANEIGFTHGVNTCMITMAMHYAMRKDYGRALDMLHKAEVMSRKKGFFNSVSIKGYAGLVYAEMGKFEIAMKYVDEVLGAADIPDKSALINALYTKMRILAARKKWNEVLTVGSEALAAAEITSIHYNDMNVMTMMAEAYAQSGDIERSKIFYDRCLARKDSLRADAVEYLHRERDLMLRLNKRENEVRIANVKLESHSKVLVLASICIVFFILVILVLVYAYRRKDALYCKIVDQHKSAIEKERKFKELLDAQNNKELIPQEKGGQETSGEEDAVGNDGTTDLYVRLCRLMETDKVYTDPMINRETIVEMLSTNRTYLSQAIKKESGLNLSQFINKYRIQEAVRILSEYQSDDIKLKDIWQQVGFVSKNTFARAFRQEVGMLPTEYKETLNKMEKKRNNTQCFD